MLTMQDWPHVNVNCRRSYSPRICAIMTLQNWWRSVLANKLDCSPPSDRNDPNDDGTATDGEQKRMSGPEEGSLLRFKRF